MLSTNPRQSGLSQWFTTPLGAHILQLEQGYFDRELADVFGFHALQVGLPEHDFLRANRIAFRTRTAPNGHGAFLSDPCALPVQSGVIDLVVLPHVLEFSSNPHQVLREVSRILMPEGHVVISGFNPWSLWGARRLAASNGGYPWCGQFINLPRLRDWMALLNFEVAAGRMGCYAPPVANDKWRQRFDFMEKAGDRWWPFAGGVYLLHAIKRVHGMRVITPKWRVRPEKRKAFAAVPHKQAHPDDALAAKQRLPDS